MGSAANVKTLVSPKPDYPMIARQLLEEGTVIATVEIGADGLPKQIKVRQSSGFGSLDQAAVKALEQWRFAPAMRDGTAVATTVEIPLVFKLRRTAGAGR
jgi:protein TonB